MQRIQVWNMYLSEQNSCRSTIQ